MSLNRPKDVPAALLALLLAAIVLFAAPAAASSLLDEAPSHHAPFDEGVVHYKMLGQGAATVVLVHGWSCRLDLWREVVQELATDFQVLALDLPGHGKSSAPDAQYTFSRFAKGLAAVMNHAGVQQAVLAGHSMGYPVCRRFALDHPRKTLGLAIIDGAVLTPPPDDPAALAIWNREMQSFAQQFKGPKADDNARNFFRSMFGPELTPALQDEVLACLESTPRHVRASAMEHFIDPAAWDVPPLLQPAAALYALSPELPPDMEGQLRASHPKLQFTTLSNAGHFFLLTHHEEIADFLRELIASLP